MVDPSQEDVRAVFDYNPSGLLLWRSDGTQAGGCRKDGRWTVGMSRKRYLRCRLVWAWHYGPSQRKLRHINGDVGDDRIENLVEGEAQDVLDRASYLYRYDPVTGHVIRKVSEYGYKEGDVAGAIRNGYLVIRVLKRSIPAHAFAWFCYYGKMPSSAIDHVNGVKSDNRISNLRLANKRENGWNAKRSIKNTSGAKGVYWHKGKWCAYVTANGKRHWLGRFSSKDEAISVRRAAAERLHGEFARHE